MSWSEYIPSIVALAGIPLAVGLGWLKDRNLKSIQDQREDIIRQEAQRREDSLLEHQSLEWISQRWWERKATANSQIVEALWQSQEYSKEYLEYAYGQSPSFKANGSEKFSDYTRNQVNLKRTADIGAFVISTEASEALERYFSSTRQAAHWEDTVDIAENHLQAAAACLREVKRAAIEDLRVSNDFRNKSHEFR